MDTRRARARQVGTDSGAYAVEFALILLVFIPMMIATLNFANMFSVRGRITDVARDAARAAARMSAPGAAQAEAQRVATQRLQSYGMQDRAIVTTDIVSAPGGPAVDVRIDYRNELWGGGIIPQQVQDASGLNSLRATVRMSLQPQ